MNTNDALLRNTFWYGVVTAIGLVSGLAMSIVLARGLGPTLMGDYSYLLWALRTMTALAILGFPLATTRYTAAAIGRGDARLAGGFLRLFTRRQLVSTAIVVVALLPLIAWLAPADLRLPMIVVILGLFPSTLESIYVAASYGYQRYDLTAQASTLKMVLQLLAAIAALSLGGGILGLVIGGTLATVASCAVQRQRALTLYPDRQAVVASPALADVRAYVVPLSVVVVLDALVWDRSEVFFLRLFRPSEEIAFYSLAFGLATRGMIVASIVAGPLLSAFALLHGRGEQAEFERVYRLALRWIALVGAPLAAIGAALSPGVIQLLYGPAYWPVAVLMGPMLAVALAGTMRGVGQAALRAGGDRTWTLHSTWLAAVVNVAAAMLLIPWYGMWGALVANAVAQLLATALTFAGVARRERCRLPVFDVARTLAAATLGAIVARLVAGGAATVPELVVAAALGFVAFVGAALAFGALGTREWSVLRAAASRIPTRAALAGLAAIATVLLVALYAPVLVDLVRVWSTASYYSYGFVVPVFSAWLGWEARRELASPAPEVSATGVALVVGGASMLVAGVAVDSLTLRALSLPVLLLGGARLLLGGATASRLVFPVAFLAFMAPLPEAPVARLSLPLQQLAAWFAGATLPLVGVPTMRQGLLIRLPHINLLVTEACNGLRFLFAMLVLGTAFAWTTQRGTARRAAVVALAAVVAVAANLVRVTGTGVLAYYWGPEAATGFFHIVYGKVVYFVMLLPFVVGVLLLRRPARLGQATDAA